MPLRRLGDDLTRHVVARVPILHYTKLSITSPVLRNIISSEELYNHRKSLKLQEPIVYVAISQNQNSRWYFLGLKPSSGSGYWLMSVPMPLSYFPSSSNSVAALKSKIYMIGGEGDVFSKLMIMDSVTHAWTDTIEMSHPRMVKGCSLYVVEDSVVVVDQGGKKGLSLEIFNAVACSWEYVSVPELNMNSKLVLAGPCEGNIGVWLFSSEDGHGTKHVYDLKSHSWSSHLSHIAPCMFYTQTLLIGGLIVRFLLGFIHCYDEEKKKFSVVKGYNNLGKQIFHAAVSAGGNLLAFGHCSRNIKVESQGLWTEEIKLEKVGGSVVASLLWSNKTLSLDQSPRIRFLGSTYVTK